MLWEVQESVLASPSASSRVVQGSVLPLMFVACRCRGASKWEQKLLL